ncbi:IS6 family transposase [Lentilitoribacter sp. EG35]|uniref:IS6 family transposase n=1 Tax=Lentilitoribacter sp. EG35 TaxID=3234192 RepID=UPI00345FC064
MKNHPKFPSLKGHRFPRSVVSYSVWAYFRFNMSLRDVEDLLAERGVAVSYETIRSWVAKFGQQYARSIRRDRPIPNDKWHLDEVVIVIKGQLWRAIDANGDILDILVQSCRNTRAAIRFMRKLVKQYGEPRVLITDELGSHGAAKRQLIPGVEHRQHKGLNNKAEVSHRQTRRREKIFGRFKSPRQAQMFLAAHDQIACLFRPRRHTLSSNSYRQARSDAHSLWCEYSDELTA